jgi:hypothetical protein
MSANFLVMKANIFIYLITSLMENRQGRLIGRECIK